LRTVAEKVGTVRRLDGQPGDETESWGLPVNEGRRADALDVLGYERTTTRAAPLPQAERRRGCVGMVDATSCIDSNKHTTFFPRNGRCGWSRRRAAPEEGIHPGIVRRAAGGLSDAEYVRDDLAFSRCTVMVFAAATSPEEDSRTTTTGMLWSGAISYPRLHESNAAPWINRLPRVPVRRRACRRRAGRSGTLASLRATSAWAW